MENENRNTVKQGEQTGKSTSDGQVGSDCKLITQTLMYGGKE